MKFNEKIQHLRKEKGLTQEELAKELFVSRTAISKWESGRGYPGIESLKAIADFFAVSVDDLLSGGEALTIAKEEQVRKSDHIADLVFGLLDISVAMFLFLPFLGQKTETGVLAVSLLSFDAVNYVKIPFFAIAVSMVIYGIATLALQYWERAGWMRYKRSISFLLNIIAVLLFVISPQPNCAVFCLVMLVIKAMILFKKA